MNKAELNQRLSWQKTPHTSPSRTSYGVSFVRIWKKVDRDKTSPHCIYSALRPTLQPWPSRVSADEIKRYIYNGLSHTVWFTYLRWSNFLSKLWLTNLQTANSFGDFFKRICLNLIRASLNSNGNNSSSVQVVMVVIFVPKNHSMTNENTHLVCHKNMHIWSLFFDELDGDIQKCIYEGKNAFRPACDLEFSLTGHTPRDHISRNCA